MNMKRLFYAFLLVGALVTINSCKKPKNTPPTPPAGALVLWSNVHIVDSTQWILHGPQPGAQGVYSFTFTPTTPNVFVQIGDILVGATNGGYIRRVTKTVTAGSRFDIYTTQATMADVFKSGTFTLQVPLNDPNQSQPGIYRSFSNFPFFSKYGYTVNFVNASFDIQPDFAITFAFDSTGLTNFQMSTTNSSARDTVVIALNGYEPYNWSKDTLLASLSSSVTQWVQAYGNISVPIVMQLNFNLFANAIGGDANEPAPTNTTATWISNSAFTAGLQYSANAWQPLHGLLGSNSAALDSPAVCNSVNTRISFVSQISSLFYTIPGPNFTLGLSADVIGTARTHPNYSCRTDASSYQTDAQSGTAIFGPNMGTISKTFYADSVFFQKPYQLVYQSGNNQVGNIAVTLPSPLVVKVLDSDGNPVSNVVVTFTAATASGDGYLGGGSSSLVVFTDQNGLAQTSWTLGALHGNGVLQTVKASVVDGNLVPISGAPFIFTATAQ